MTLISWAWDGEAMRPMARFVKRANDFLVVGERYLLEPVDEAQSAQDRAYHASIRDHWMHLPEEMAERFANPTDFRRWLLVETGFCDVAKLAFASSKAALAALPFLQSEGAQISVVGAVMVVKKPWSQKLRGGMKREDRLRSYQETQDLAAALVGASANDVSQHGAEAA